MDKTIIVILGLIAASSMLLNYVLVKVILSLKKNRKDTKKSNKKFIKALVKSLCLIDKEANKFKEQVKTLDAQLDVAANLLEEYRGIALYHKGKYDAVFDAYMTVTQTLCDFIRDNKVIKTTYMDNVITYDFNSLTKQETERFFGKQLIQ